MAAWVVAGSLTSLIALVGVAFGGAFLQAGDPIGFMDAATRMDGRNYQSIAENGYTYHEREPSIVAFFPAYPIAARWVARSTGISTLAALLTISNLCWIAAFVLMGAYLEKRKPASDLPPPASSASLGRALTGSPPTLFQANEYPLLAMGLLPTTFFFRMPYSESMFLLLAVLSLYAIARSWPPVGVAIVVGLATAVRPVGVSLLLPLLWYAWKRSGSTRAFAWRAAYLVPVACWGLEIYMTYQWRRFGTPFAFAITQKYHRMRPIGSFADEVLALLSWEPIRDVYNPSSEGYWRLFDLSSYPAFSLIFMTPIYLLGTAGLVALGAAKRWLTTYEALLAVPLLVIPYFTRAYEMRMMSQARFAAVVFPAYIVLGRLLSRLHPVVAMSLLAASGAVMGFYAAIFSTGKHSFF
jgi:hypothetical protein